MAKIKNYQGKEVKQLTKKEIDASVSELLLLDEVIKEKQKRVKELKELLESQYVKPPEEEETIAGVTHQYKKVPVNNGKNDYDDVKLKSLLSPLKVFKKIVTTTRTVLTTVNDKELKVLIKAGKITEEQLAECRNNNWTFKTNFARKESETVKANKKAAN